MKLLTETTFLHLCHYTMAAIKLVLNHFANINWKVLIEKKTHTYVAGPEQWLRRIGYRWPYGDLCGGDAPLGGDPNTQYVPYCGNQHPARLLIVVLLYFLWVRHHKYAAVGMVLSPEVLFNIRLDLNVFRLCSELKRCHYTAGTNAYGTKDAHY